MKEIKFQLNGGVIAAGLGTRVEKKALYGYSKYIAEKDGVALSRGYLDQNGALLQRAAMASLKLDPEGSPVEEVITEIDGTEAALVPSSFEREAELTPQPWTALVGFNVTDVYPLEAVRAEPGLYQTDFNYRKSATPKEALLVVKEEGAWLLAGVRRTPAFVGLSVAYAFFDSGDEAEGEEAEMDFGMI